MDVCMCMCYHITHPPRPVMIYINPYLEGSLNTEQTQRLSPPPTKVPRTEAAHGHWIVPDAEREKLSSMVDRLITS